MRPQTLKQFIGQEENVKPILYKALSKKDKLLPSMLLFGTPGTGKTSLSKVIANEAGYEYSSVVASKDITPQRLRQLLLDLNIAGYKAGGVWQEGAKRFIFFIDEAHQLSSAVCDSVLTTAIEDLEVHTPNGLIHWLPDICYILATTSPNIIPVSILSRLPLQFHLEPYSTDDLVKIIRTNYPKMPVDMANEVARRSGGVPRLALSYSCQVEICDYDLLALNKMVNEEGLTELDRRYLKALESSDGRGMSLSTLASICREEPRVLVSMVETKLLYLGKIAIGRTGRMLVSERCERGSKIKGQ
jgi:Holliday junction resolvasome RuvABC ATP-dependent DNA helicase subunit